MPDALGTLAIAETRRTRAETSPAELAAILAGDVAPDARRVTVGRVYSVDLPAALRRWARGYGKSERETLRTDALLWISEREALKLAEHRRDRAPNRGRAVAAYVHEAYRATRGGFSATMPLRRDWVTRDASGRSVLSREAWRTLHTALNVAKNRGETRQGEARAMAEIPTDGRALAELAEHERREDAPETLTYPEHGATLIAQAMGLPESAARALIYDAHGLTPDDAAELWNVARVNVARIIFQGRRTLAERYPDPRDLIDAIRDAAPAVREALTDAAERTLGDWRDGYATERDARTAAAEWRSEVAAMTPERRALTVAARSAGTGEELAERVALSVSRIVRAETERARQWATLAARGPRPLPTHPYGRAVAIPIARVAARPAYYAQTTGAALTPERTPARRDLPRMATRATRAERLDCSGQSYPHGLRPSAPKLAPDATVAGMPAYSKYHPERATLRQREALAALDAPTPTPTHEET